ADDLTERGFAAGAVHGDLGQSAREQALRAFRSGKIDVLVATDVAARGIDVDDVTHVINYQSPEDEKTYIHRIGRTGRAGRAGVAVTPVDCDEEQRMRLSSGKPGLGTPEPEETYSTSDHLYTDLGIPREATGRLPLAKRTRAGLAAEEAEDFGGKRAGGPRSQSPGKRRSRKRTRSGRSASAGKQQADTAAGQAQTAPEARPDEPPSSAPGKPSGTRRRRPPRPSSRSTSAAGDASPAPGSREPHKRTGTRSPWTRPRDRIAAAIIVVLVVVVGAVVWAQSDSRATSRSTARPVPALPEPAQPPERLTEAWRAPSPATVVPV